MKNINGSDTPKQEPNGAPDKPTAKNPRPPSPNGLAPPDHDLETTKHDIEAGPRKRASIICRWPGREEYEAHASIPDTRLAGPSKEASVAYHWLGREDDQSDKFDDPDGQALTILAWPGLDNDDEVNSTEHDNQPETPNGQAPATHTQPILEGHNGNSAGQGNEPAAFSGDSRAAEPFERRGPGHVEPFQRRSTFRTVEPFERRPNPKQAGAPIARQSVEQIPAESSNEPSPIDRPRLSTSELSRIHTSRPRPPGHTEPLPIGGHLPDRRVTRWTRAGEYVPYKERKLGMPVWLPSFREHPDPPSFPDPNVYDEEVEFDRNRRDAGKHVTDQQPGPEPPMVYKRRRPVRPRHYRPPEPPPKPLWYKRRYTWSDVKRGFWRHIQCEGCREDGGCCNENGIWEACNCKSYLAHTCCPCKYAPYYHLKRADEARMERVRKRDERREAEEQLKIESERASGQRSAVSQELADTGSDFKRGAKNADIKGKGKGKKAFPDGEQGVRVRGRRTYTGKGKGKARDADLDSEGIELDELKIR